ncbi:MAG: hypothetical protein ABJC13_13595 [Acidobacteriota bacterium]
MSASTPRFRPAHLLLIGWIGLLTAAAGSAPASAQPFDFGISARTVSTWIDDFSRWFDLTGKPTPPESGTCIDPNGKPRPCDSGEVAPPGAKREPDRASPRG